MQANRALGSKIISTIQVKTILILRSLASRQGQQKVSKIFMLKLSWLLELCLSAWGSSELKGSMNL